MQLHIKQLPENEFIQHSLYDNNHLFDIEYNCVKTMYNVAGNRISHYKPEQRFNDLLKNPYVTFGYELKTQAHDLRYQKVYFPKLSTIERITMSKGGAVTLDGMCEIQFAACPVAEAAAACAYFVSECAMYDFLTDCDLNRYEIKASNYYQLAMTWMHNCINILKQTVDFQEIELISSTPITYVESMEDSCLPDLTRHNKLVNLIKNVVVRPLIDANRFVDEVDKSIMEEIF